MSSICCNNVFWLRVFCPTSTTGLGTYNLQNLIHLCMTLLLLYTSGYISTPKNGSFVTYELQTHSPLFIIFMTIHWSDFNVWSHDFGVMQIMETWVEVNQIMTLIYGSNLPVLQWILKPTKVDLISVYFGKYWCDQK